MNIIIDSREQEPYSFRFPVLRKKLDAGDYSVEGFEKCVAVERKSLTDFVHTIVRGRKRFYKELVKLRLYDSACVVVEGSLRSILEGKYHSDVHPNALIGSIMSIMQDFTVPVYFCHDRPTACRFTEEYLAYYVKRSALCV